MTKGIYCYLDIEQDKIVYIGKDSHIDKNQRHKDHYKQCNYNIQKINQVLQNNLNRYKYYVLWTIDDCTDNHLNQMEIYFINKYNPKFNFTKGGDGISGFKHSEESKQKMSKNNARYWKGKKRSEEARQKMSEAKKDKKLSDEHKRKISENNARYWEGKKLSKETRQKMSESKKGTNHPMFGKKLSKETRQKISENNARYWEGKKLSKETRQKISEKQSERHNTTGFYRISKEKGSSYKQGFRWVYRYFDNNKHKSISSIDLKKLEEKVRKEGLEWKIIDKENSIKSMQENNNCF